MNRNADLLRPLVPGEAAMKVFLASGMEELQRFEDSYNVLLQRVGGIESLYYSLDYIRTSLETFAELGASLFFIVVLEGDMVVAVLPLQLVTDALGARRTLRFWGQIDSLYARNPHQKILADGNQPIAMNAAVAFLKTEARKMWDVVELSSIKMEDENIQNFVAQFAQAQTTLREDRYYWYNTALDLDQHLRVKMLREIRRRRRRMEEEVGPIELSVKEAIGPADLLEIKSLHTARQQYKQNGGDFFSDPLADRYVCDLIELWNEKKCMRYYALRVEGRLVAFRIVTHAAGVANLFVVAFDSALKKYAPARLLTHETYRLEAERFHTHRIESGWGATGLKEDYSSETYDLYNVKIVNKSVRTTSMLRLIGAMSGLRQRFSACNRLIHTLKSISGR